MNAIFEAVWQAKTKSTGGGRGHAHDDLNGCASDWACE